MNGCTVFLAVVPAVIAAVGAVSLNDAVMVFAAVTAPPVAGLVVPDKYVPEFQFVNAYPVFGVAVAVTVSPYLTVKLPFELAPAFTVTLLLPWVTVDATVLPFAFAVTVIVYVALLYQQLISLLALIDKLLVFNVAVLVVGAASLYPFNVFPPVGFVHILACVKLVPVFI